MKEKELSCLMFFKLNGFKNTKVYSELSGVPTRTLNHQYWNNREYLKKCIERIKKEHGIE